MRDNYDALKTEARNPRTMAIDKMSTYDMMKTINEEDQTVPAAVATQLSEIAKVVDLAAASLEKGGHLIYVGAGTSGRLGVVDASECPPTFGVDYNLVRGIIAGGDSAMFRAVEGAEDNEALGAAAIEENGVLPGDVVVGLSAAGRAPIVLGALKKAREIGAIPVGITCNPQSLMAPLCDVTIAPYVGPEVISGSTLLKAGTAQKLILNMISTGTMIKTGKVMGNLMINVRPSNEKLKERAARILMQISGCDHDTAVSLLAEYGDIRAALRSLGIV